MTTVNFPGVDIGLVNGGGLIGAMATPNLPKLRKALANTLLGVSRTKILVLGDSTSLGRGAGTTNSGYDGAKPKSFPVQIAKELSARFGIPMSWDNFLGTGGLDTGWAGYDTRLSLGAGWAPAGLLTQQSWGGEPVINSTTTNAFTFTPTGSWDTADVYYIQQTGYDTCNVAIGGVNIGSFNANNATVALKKATFTSGGAAAVQACAVTRTNVGTSAKIVGIDCYNSAVPAVSVLVSAKGGTVVNYWATGGSAYNVSQSAVWDLLAPDMTFIDLTINDWNANSQAGTNPTTFTTDTQTLITLAKRTGDAGLLVGNPSATPGFGNATAAVQAVYEAIYQSLAQSNSAMFYDQIYRLGSYTLANPNGYYYDSLHLTGMGQMDIARQLAKMIAG